MALRPPTATIRTQVRLPLRFADGFKTADLGGQLTTRQMGDAVVERLQV